jgi:hypothetical protein
MSQAPAGSAHAQTIASDLPFDPAATSLPRGLRRFGKQLEAFGQALAAAERPWVGPAEPGAGHRPHLEEASVGHRLYAANGRTPLFMLQGLARLERGMRKEHLTFDELLGPVKVLEDALGAVDFWWGFLTSAEKWGLPVEVCRWSELQHAHACGKLESWLLAHDWVAHRYQPKAGKIRLRLNQMGRALQEEAWLGPRRERRKLAAFLVARLRKIHASALMLDMDDLEGGLHELRRKLRWVSIYAMALEGALTLDEQAAPPPSWDRYLTDAVVTSKFAKLPLPDADTDPLLIPAPLFYALSWVIADLGDVKDRAQCSETIAAGLRATRQAGQATQWLGEKALDHHAAGDHARAVLEQALLRDAVLLRLADAIEGQI